jgi:hypothetical protein
MSLPVAGPERMRYIIRATGDVAPLASFLDSVRLDPGMTLVDTIGPPGARHTAIIDMERATAQLLEQRFSSTHQLTIEPDRPLTMFR